MTPATPTGPMRMLHCRRSPSTQFPFSYSPCQIEEVLFYFYIISSYKSRQAIHGPHSTSYTLFYSSTTLSLVLSCTPHPSQHDPRATTLAPSQHDSRSVSTRPSRHLNTTLAPSQHVSLRLPTILNTTHVPSHVPAPYSVLAILKLTRALSRAIFYLSYTHISCSLTCILTCSTSHMSIRCFAIFVRRLMHYFI